MKLASLQLPGDGWRIQHKWRTVADARERGVAVHSEVYGMLAACTPQPDRSRFDAQPVRTSQGLVPDLLLTVQR